MSRLVTRRLRTVVQTSGLVRKEVSQTLRQPQLLLLLVAGPFVILLIFGFGYDEEQMALRTRFVGPEDSIFQTAVSDYAELLGDYIEPEGYTSDLFAARRDLERGEIDLVVAFPADAVERLTNDEQAPITILHDKIDPIQLTAVEIAARLAVGEVNATILEALVDRGLEGMRPVDEQLADATAAANELEQAARAGDDAAVETHYREVESTLSGGSSSLPASARVLRVKRPFRRETADECFRIASLEHSARVRTLLHRTLRWRGAEPAAELIA